MFKTFKTTDSAVDFLWRQPYNDRQKIKGTAELDSKGITVINGDYIVVDFYDILT